MTKPPEPTRAGGRLTRRWLSSAALPVLLGCGSLPIGSVGAQPVPRPGARPAVVMATPMPCGTRPGDLVGLVLDGTGAPAGTVTVFGHAFRIGHLPRGAGLSARLTNGSSVPTQLDVLTRHPDGSARFAIVSLAAPALARGQQSGLLLATLPEPAGQLLAIDAALAGHGAVVEVIPATGDPWRYDLLAGWRAGGLGGAWQSGPLVVQRRITTAVPAAAVGGATSARLVADIAIRADGSIWADVWIRNDVAMRPGGGGAEYALRVLLDGTEVLRSNTLKQWQYSGWGRLLANRGAATPPMVRHDAGYLAETAAIAHYDVTSGVEERALQRMAQMVAEPGWAAPLGPRGVTQSMGTTGGRPDLGQTTMWQAAWLISGDPRAAEVSIGQAETAGAVPWHFWDVSGGADGRGGWMDERRWPQFWLDARGGRPPRTLLQPIPPGPDTGGWRTSASHQPNLSFVPFLLTGRRAFLDELQVQATWNVLDVWPAARSYDATGPIRGVNLVDKRQVRSAAWSMRQVGDAAWISPDSDANQPYLREVAAANWTWLRAQLPAWTQQQGEVHGYIPWTGYGANAAMSPWQQDYFASTAAAAAARGSEDARAVLAWMSNFIVGRFHAEARGFGRHDAVAYVLAIMPAPPPRQPSPETHYTTWAQIGAATRERDLSNGSGWIKSNGEYARLAMLSLAVVIDVLGTEDARQAYAWLSTSGAPFTQPEVFTRMPQHNIAPRGMPRGRPSAACAGGKGI